MDYRGLNKITTPNRYPLPLMNKLREKTQGSQWFTKLDLKNGYYLIWIKEGDEWKTAFKTKYGLYEYTVMPFRLINAPSSFQEMMDEVLQGIEEEVHYLDNILINTSGTEEENQASVKQVLEKLMNHDFAVNLSKSEFYVKETVFLGYVINGSEVKIDGAKIKTTEEWAVPQKKKELQVFLEFANYYQRFIRNYSQGTKPLTEFTKDVPLYWGHQQQMAFDELKAEFQQAPILVQWDRSLPTLLETDTSNQAVVGVLSQLHLANPKDTLSKPEW